MTRLIELMRRGFGLAWSASPRARMVQLNPSAGPIYAVGDIHGCLGLWKSLQQRINEDAAAFSGRAQVVLLGDMIDWGPDTAGLLDDLVGLTRRGEILAIRGNHEAMMLDFFSVPRRNIDWLLHGGFETLRSYGLTLDRGEAGRLPLRRLAAILAAHVPPDHLAWLAALPTAASVVLNGRTCILAHAGYEPNRPLDRQRERALIWGPAPDPAPGHLLVHGHVVVEAPQPLANCVAVDTGAWKTGKLTALRLVADCCPAVLSVCKFDKLKR